MSELDGKLRVMLVDDHALVRSAVRQAIAAPDIELVGEAANAQETMAVAPVLRPDVLLLDIDLPGMNGIQLVQELAPRLPNTKIVMLTVSSSERDLLEAVARGAAGYLTKDLSPEALLRTLRGVQRGELAMSRRFAARALRYFADAARRGRNVSGAEGELMGLVAARERCPGDAGRRLDRPRDRQCADHLATHGRDSRQQHPAQARGPKSCGGRAAISTGRVGA